MGTEAVWVPLVLAAASSGAAAYNAHETAKDQDRAAAISIKNQQSKQQEADQRVSQQVDALEQSSPEASRKRATDAFMTQLARTRKSAVAGGPAGASSRYNADLGSATNDVNQFGAQVADTMARINAPSEQRLAEGQGAGRLASDLGAIGRAASGDAFLDNLRMRSIRNNPYVDAASQLGSGIAGGMTSYQGRYGTGKTGRVPGGTMVDTPVRSGSGAVYG